MKKRYALLLTVALVLVAAMSFPTKAFAECNHDWGLIDQYTDEYSDTQHKTTKIYECSECSATKEEESYSNHSWQNSGDRYDCNKISDTQHTYVQDQYCTACDRYREVKGTENHSFDKYNFCDPCGALVGKTVTLAAGKTAYVNEKSWVKIKIAKKGYIQVTTKGRWDDYNPPWTLYNSSKAVFVDSKYKSSKSAVPVKKGTYYIKVAGEGSVTYSFKKDPSKKNYTSKKATSLKKKKKVTTVIYPSDKKKTWTRYYKIKLTKAQKVRIYAKELGENWYTYAGIVDSKGYYYDMDWEYNKAGEQTNVISKKLKKGTYYIVIRENYGSSSKKRSAGTVYTLKWK